MERSNLGLSKIKFSKPYKNVKMSIEIVSIHFLGFFLPAESKTGLKMFDLQNASKFFNFRILHFGPAFLNLVNLKIYTSDSDSVIRKTPRKKFKEKNLIVCWI